MYIYINLANAYFLIKFSELAKSSLHLGISGTCILRRGPKKKKWVTITLPLDYSILGRFLLPNSAFAVFFSFKNYMYDLVTWERVAT